MDRRFLLSLWIVLLACFSCSENGGLPSVTSSKGTVEDIREFAQREDTNVLFVVIDTLRADHLSAYGYERETSPLLEELADTGVRFDRHVAQSSWTKCSMASLWTGMYPATTGVTRASHVLPDDAVLPAEVLQEAGFRTAGIWRNSWIAPNFGFSQGFQTYTKPAPSTSPQPNPAESPNVLLAGSDGDAINSAFGFLRAYGQKRWFLYLHLMDVHQYVYSPDEAVFGTTYEDIYDNAILWTDHLLGYLLDDLEDRGLLERTLIVVVSDHGEAFGEHGGEGHARNVYEEVTRTPWIIRFPFELEEGIEVSSLTANVDVWPTLMDLLGLPEMESADGKSRVPEIIAFGRGEEPPPESDAFALLDRRWGHEQQPSNPNIAVNQGKWRFFQIERNPDRLELYDKSIDPAEEVNLANENPEVVKALQGVIAEHLEDSSPPWGEAPTIEIDELQLNQLRALGYGVQ